MRNKSVTQVINKILLLSLLLFQVTGLQQECAIVEVFSLLIVETRFYLEHPVVVHASSIKFFARPMV